MYILGLKKDKSRQDPIIIDTTFYCNFKSLVYILGVNKDKFLILKTTKIKCALTNL